MAWRRFVGIVTKYFEVVHNELKTTDLWKRSVPSYAATISKRMKARFGSCCFCWLELGAQ